MQPKGKLVGVNEFCSWNHQERIEKSVCYCGAYGSIGFNYRFGMLEILCYEHYKERIEQCRMEKERMEAKEEGPQRKLL